MTVERAMPGTIAPPTAPGVPPARVFVGIRVAPDIALQLAELAATLQLPSVRLIPPTDIHLTLVPPWNETSIPDAIAKLSHLTSGFQKFWLEFEHVCYGPQRRRPRLLWAECARSDELDHLRAALMEAHGQSDDRPFRPHVTLARIRGKTASIAREHPMDQRLSLKQRVETVELFQSPPPGERFYRILASPSLEGGSTG